MKTIKLGDIHNVDDNPELKSKFNSFMKYKFIELGDTETSKYLNTNPEFRSILKLIRKGQSHLREVLSFLDKNSPFYKKAETQFNKTKGNLSKNSYDLLVYAVEDAKEAGVDVSDIEDQMPELLKEVSRKEAETQFNKTKGNLSKNSYDLLVYAVEDAKAAGVDVSDIEDQMPELLKEVNL